MQLIPSIDLRGGQVVRLLRGDFSAETVYHETAIDLLERYQRAGAAWVHVVDLDGARDGALAHRDSIQSLAAHHRPALQVGGGVRNAARIEELRQLGVARVVVGSAAIERPDEVEQWLKTADPDALCLAFDVRVEADGIPRVHTRGWREATSVSLWEAVGRYQGRGLRHVLCTDIARDGALQGPNHKLYAEAVQRFPHIAWQASGGIHHADDLVALAALGVAAAISGRALIEGRLTDEDIRRWSLN